MIEKMIRGKVLDDLMAAMDGMEFDSKLKPKVITIHIEGGKPEPMHTDEAHESGENSVIEALEHATGIELSPEEEEGEEGDGDDYSDEEIPDVGDGEGEEYEEPEEDDRLDRLLRRKGMKA
jgi:hypothetical protein